MAKFIKGSIVINVNTKEKGVITEVLPKRRGKQFYDVKIDNATVTVSENNIIEDLDLKDPYEKFARGVFGSFDNYIQTNTIFKLNNTSNSSLSTLKASKTMFKPYQFKPLLKLLNSTNRRLLVADEVGLGKTIEAGQIMLELRALRAIGVRTLLQQCNAPLRFAQ